MSTSIIDDTDLALDRYDGNIFVITMRKAPENRLNSTYCQKLIRTFNLVRTTLGQDSEGAVITRGNDAKFWCTVSQLCHIRFDHHVLPMLRHVYATPQMSYMMNEPLPSLLTLHLKGLELDESDTNPAANSSGFFPLLATITDFPFPTIALITGHTFGKYSTIDMAKTIERYAS